MYGVGDEGFGVVGGNDDVDVGYGCCGFRESFVKLLKLGRL